MKEIVKKVFSNMYVESLLVVFTALFLTGSGCYLKNGKKKSLFEEAVGTVSKTLGIITIPLYIVRSWLFELLKAIAK